MGKRLISRPHLLILLSLSCGLPAATADVLSGKSTVISVEINGSDAANGDSTTGPVKTIQRAQSIARGRIAAMLAGTTPRAPVRVVIGAGAYPIGTTLTFTPADSGTAAAPVSYEARQAGTVVISGGVNLGSKTDSKSAATLSYLAPSDQAAINGGSQLFVNGRRATLARQPKANEAWFVQSAVTVPGEPAGKQGAEAFAAAPANLAWINGLSAADKKRAIVNVYQSWTTGKHRLSSQPAPSGSVRIMPRALWPFLSQDGTSQRYFIENVVAAFDAPGEWIYDNGSVRYMSRSDETGKPLQATLPTLEKLVVVQGDANKPVTNLQFIGLSFAHTRYLTPDAGMTDNQATYAVNAAIEVNKARGFVFSNCSMQHTGGWGIWLRDSVRDATITDSSFADLGAGAIKVGLAAQSPTDGNATGANQLVGNAVSDTGKVFPGAVGIFIGQSFDNQVLRNTIHDTTYTGISVGWSWGYAAATSGRNLIKGNLIYNIGQRQLADLAGIYTLGRSPGTVIANNIIRNVRGYGSYGAGAWGIYNDEGSSGVVMEGNVVVDTDSGGYHLHYGKDNTLSGNILAGGDTAEIQVSKPEADSNLSVKGNLIVAKNARPFDKVAAGSQIRFDGNEVTAANDSKNGKSVELSKCAGGCVLRTSDLRTGRGPTDIQSTNPAWMGVINTAIAAWGGGASGGVGAAENARGKALLDGGNSAAAAREIGSAADAAQIASSINSVRMSARSLPAVADAPKALVAPAADLVVDIAGTEPLARPVNLKYFPAANASAIQVEAQVGAPDGKCLAFNDGPGFANRYDPHAIALLNHTQGNTVVDFELKIDAGSVMVVEWRDNASPFLTGPALRISAAGVEVGGKVVASVAVDTWTKFRMSSAIGVDNPEWRLDLNPATGKKSTVNALAVKNNAWRSFNTLVFSSDANVNSHPCIASIKAINNNTSASR